MKDVKQVFKVWHIPTQSYVGRSVYRTKNPASAFVNSQLLWLKHKAEDYEIHTFDLVRVV